MHQPLVGLLTLPSVPGLDVAGIVTQSPGDRVYYHGNLRNPHGGLADYAVVSAHTVARVPESVSFAAAAAVPCAGFTAYQALHRKLHLATIAGLKPIIATCSASNVDYVRALGANEVIDYTSENVVERVLAITDGVGVDCAVDCVSGESATSLLPAIAFNGGIVTIVGEVQGAVPEQGRAISVHGLALGGAYGSPKRFKDQQDLKTMADEMMSLLAAGRIAPTVCKQVGLADVPQALRDLETRRIVGKMVVVP
ncbi:zincbinding alcohol dehydrogenase [Acanthamoeba castellanii str. Neff]|uniref:Zincbinding alcohol dehydrogenase n=1 Tax=Acanthamoeba castellanii (strain ATCC 30010 / Neff) TaxID=1257118 RepID=L8HFV2_ACACF|nr:zincbinding alcohol dehydrogenase [Acanthamoeba castellanii str. Neff]ELR24419.1 zincbinding alcohol dehydrogenase [Acanthamoeba castellanii str. Neff]